MATHARDDLAAALAAEADQGERTKDSDLEYRRRRAPAGQAVYGLRLPEDRIDQLRRVAAARGVEPSVLARTWLIQQLDRAGAGGPPDEDDHWEHDVRAATGHLRDLLDRRPGGSKTA